jgi:molybdate transport repressor ModE-like protein
MLDVRRLQMLRAVSREGSLSAAARALGYTQPAVSHHIARLEEEIGTALLTRFGRGVRLTDAGVALVDHADAVLSRLDAAEEEVAAIAGLRAGRVRLAAFASGSATLLAGALARLREAHPGVELTFVEAEPQDGLELLRAGETDLVLAFSYEAVGERDGKDITTVPLLRDPSHAILPAAHPEAGEDGPIDLGSLAGEAWIAGCERCRRHLLHVAADAGFAPRIDFETDDYLTVQSLVASGLGVSLLPALALVSARRDDVAVRPVAGRPARAIAAVLPAAERRPPAVTAALVALEGAAAELATDAHATSLGLELTAR